MTVEKLMASLSKFPKDATVTLENNDEYFNGFYGVGGIAFKDDVNRIAIHLDVNGSRNDD